MGPSRGSASFQASRLDVCCCVGAPKLPPPDQSEGLLLRSFRKFYVPLLLHGVTRVVVVSGTGGAAGGREGLLSLVPGPAAHGGVDGLPGPPGAHARGGWDSRPPSSRIFPLPPAAAVHGPVWSGALLHVPHQRGAGSGAGPAQGEPAWWPHSPGVQESQGQGWGQGLGGWC